MPKPLVSFDADGNAPVLSYNVPAPSSYSGRAYMELDFGDRNVFKESAAQRPPRQGGATGGGTPSTPSTDGGALPDLEVKERVAKRLEDLALYDFSAPVVNDLLREPKPIPGPLMQPQGDRTAVQRSALRIMLDEVGVDVVAEQVALGAEVVERPTPLSGEKRLAIAQPSQTATPRLALVEVYRLSSYLANYGAGRTVSTLTLLPGEEMTIRVNTYRRSSRASSRAETILDSFSSTSEHEFASSLQQENSTKGTEQGEFSWHAEAEAEATWGWGKAKVKGGAAGSSNSSRETFAKTVSNATAKHVAKASASRDVEVNTSSEAKVEEGEETAIERRIRNINMSRTLNFVFRQMNQEFITLLHLVDVRVAFHNGLASTYREVALSQVDDLLTDVIRDGTDGTADERDYVRQVIVDELSNIVDYRDHLRSFVEHFQPTDAAGTPVGEPYLRTLRDMVSTYTGATGENEIRVPGIVLAAQTNVLRTDGLMVEALLGEGEALDDYARGLQREAVRTQRVRNSQMEAEVDEEELANSIVSEATDKVAAFTKVHASSTRESVLLPHAHLVSDDGRN